MRSEFPTATSIACSDHAVGELATGGRVITFALVDAAKHDAVSQCRESTIDSHAEVTPILTQEVEAVSRGA